MSLRVEVLREVIGQVFVGIDVSDSELSLTCAISNPVESHVHGFGVDNTVVLTIVSLKYTVHV